MTQNDGLDEMEPRHFWRRGLAFILDIIIAQLIAALLFAGVDAAAGISLGDASLTNTKTECSVPPANHQQVLRVEAMWPLPPSAERQNLICRQIEGKVETFAFTTKVITKDGNSTYTKSATYPIDKDGKALPIDYQLDLTPFVVVLYFILLSARGVRTPGKSAMGLKLLTNAGSTPGWSAIVRRETLKLLPVLSYGLLVIWVVVGQPRALTDSEAVITTVRDGHVLTSPLMLLWIAILLGTLVWWFGSFAVWRGRTWYDAIAGTKIIWSDRPRANGRPEANGRPQA